MIFFWCQLASIFLPKIDQNLCKNRFQKASIFWSIWASIFAPFWLHLGIQLGAMLTTFSLKTGGLNLKLPSFLLDLCYFSIWGPSWPPLGTIWARFWRVRGSILEVFARITPTCAIQQRLLSPGKANRAAHNSKSKPSLTHPHQPPHEQTCQGVGGCSGSF